MHGPRWRGRTLASRRAIQLHTTVGEAVQALRQELTCLTLQDMAALPPLEVEGQVDSPAGEAQPIPLHYMGAFASAAITTRWVITEPLYSAPLVSPWGPPACVDGASVFVYRPPYGTREGTFRRADTTTAHAFVTAWRLLELDDLPIIPTLALWWRMDRSLVLAWREDELTTRSRDLPATTTHWLPSERVLGRPLRDVPGMSRHSPSSRSVGRWLVHRPDLRPSHIPALHRLPIAAVALVIQQWRRQEFSLTDS